MINKLGSTQEYRSLIEEYKKICPKPFSNANFMLSYLERYINLEKISFESTPQGLFFYFDEGTYYKVYFYVDEKQPFTIPVYDKKLLIRNMYNNRRKNDRLIFVRERLGELGFLNKGISVQIEGNVQDLLRNCAPVEKYEKEIEKKGYCCIEAEYSLFDKIEKIIVGSDILEDYHIISRTDQEKKELEKGSYLCILNEKKDICAASIAVINSGIAQAEEMVVKDEYKMRGFAPILTYQRLKWLDSKNIQKIEGWILTHNESSLRYHRKLGYHFTDKYVEEWILEKV